MSMNIEIQASRSILYKDSRGVTKHDEQIDYFPAWQTPTEITNQIIDLHTLEDQVDKYIKYFSQYHPRNEHYDELKQWISNKQKEGYTIIFIMV